MNLMMSAVMKARIGASVHVLRVRKDLTRQDFAERTGIALDTLKTVEWGDFDDQDVSLLPRICEVLDTTPEGLYAESLKMLPADPYEVSLRLASEDGDANTLQRQ